MGLQETMLINLEHSKVRAKVFMKFYNIFGDNHPTFCFKGGLLKTTRAPDGGELLPRNFEEECPGGKTNNCFRAGTFLTKLLKCY